jgi:transmembrane sensor
MRPALKTSRSKMAAAAIVLLLGLGVYVRIFVAGEAYATPVGGVSSIPLQDGSSVTLNTATKVRVSLTDRERHIELEAGEAFFVVAKDPSRPFVVTVGNRRVVAVGTRFSVRREGEDIQVVVTEGKVRIEPREDGQAAQLLSAGAVVQTERNAVRVEQRSLGAAEAALSWRGGYLIFNDTALADAVAELNRYTSRRIVIDDPALAGLKISGKFQSTLATDFVKLLRDGFGVEVRDHGGTVHLSSREGLMNSVPP